MKYMLLIGLFSLSSIFSFGQDSSTNDIMIDFKNRGRKEREEKYTGKNKKEGFNFWFFSSKPKRSYSSHRHMKIFDSHSIFDFDREIALAISNSSMAREDFKREARLLSAQIKYYEEELIHLLNEQLEGIDRSDSILEAYNTLYELSYKNFSMMNNHTKVITDIFTDTFEAYDMKIREKIKTAETNKNILVDELTTRYNMFLDQ